MKTDLRDFELLVTAYKKLVITAKEDIVPVIGVEAAELEILHCLKEEIQPLLTNQQEINKALSNMYFLGKLASKV